VKGLKILLKRALTKGGAGFPRALALAMRKRAEALKL
jgi:hypothetical protein